jgi:hypothetical protein
VDPFVIEADRQSDTTTPSRPSLGVCMKAIVTVMASKAAMEAQKNQVDPFAFDNPVAVDEDHRNVLTFAAEVVVEEQCPEPFDEVSLPSVGQVFISDIMDMRREADEGGSVPDFAVGYHDKEVSSHEVLKGKVRVHGTFIDSESSSTGQVLKKREANESMPHRCLALFMADDDHGVEEVSRRTASKHDFNGTDMVNLHGDSDGALNTVGSSVLDKRVGIGTSTDRTPVDKYDSFVDLADAHFCMSSQYENDFEDEVQHRPTKYARHVDFDWMKPKLKNSKNTGRGHQFHETIEARVGEHRQSNAQLGGAFNGVMGRTEGVHSRGKFESQQQPAVSENRFDILAGDDGDEVTDTLMEIDTAIGAAAKSSASESSSSSTTSFLVSKPTKGQRKLRKQRLARSAKRLGRRNVVRANDAKSKMEYDPEFVGFPDLVPEGDGILEMLNRDTPAMIECFHSLVQESFPEEVPASDAQILYVMDGNTEVYAHAAFMKELREQVGSGKEIWLVLDTGANQHVIKDVEIMKNRRSTFAKVVGVSGSLTALDCEGSVMLDLKDALGTDHKLELTGAYGLATCPFNLVSVSKLVDEKYWLSLNGKTGEHFLELPNSSIRIPIIRKDGLLLLKPYQASTESVQLGGAGQASGSVFLSTVNEGATVDKESTGNLSFSGNDYGMNAPMTRWHERVRHIPMEKLNQIHNQNLANLNNKHKKLETISQIVSGGGDVILDEDDSDENEVNLPGSDRRVRNDEPMIHGFFKPHDDKSMKHTNCDVCRQANLRKKPQKHHSLFQQSDLKLGRVFSTDLKSVSIRSFHGHGYAISFVEHTDDGSPGIVFVYLMKNKSEATAMLQRFINDCKKLGIKIAKIQSDRGTEYFEQEGIGKVYDERAHSAFRALCNKNNIDHTVTPVGDKEKFAERWNKEHFKTVDVYLWNARLAPQFWSYALEYSVYQYNRTPVQVGGVWFKSPHHYYTGEVPRWDKWRVFGCDAFNLIANNKYAKYPGLPTGKRSIFVGFDKDGGSLLFDMEKRKHFHSNHTYFNECFQNRHNALHYFDQRRYLAHKDLPQPLQLNDFDADHAQQVRNLYVSPADLVKATQVEVPSASSSSNVGIGGDGVAPGASGVTVGSVSEPVGSFHDALSKESVIESNEKDDPTVRPLRLESPGTVQKWSSEHREFLRRAELFNYPIKMQMPCPKKGNSGSSTRYKTYMFAETIKELRALGAWSTDITWDYQHGYMQFPGRESKRSGHVFNVFIHDPSQQAVETVNGDQKRDGMMNQVLIDVDKDIAHKKECEELMQMLQDKSLVVKFADSCGESLRALTAHVKPTLNQFVDWHIAAEPTHYNQTLSHCCTEHEEWELAMEEEIQSMKRFDVFEEIDRRFIPKDRQILDCKWVYKRKRDKDGKIVRYRARVVAMGFRQRAYDSFIPEETHSPVVSKDTLRLFLSICAQRNLTIYQADVKAAFLQAPLKEEIYMKAPPGYRGAKDGHEVIWKLKSAVYGLKQASACFWTAVHQHLVKIGFHSLTGDPCLFQKNLGGGKKMLVCCYVDDITYAVENKEIGDAFLDDMRKRFFISEDEGKPIEWLLGMAIKQDVVKGTVSMNMASMIDKLANLILTDEERVKSVNVVTPMLVTPLVKLAEREVSVEQFDYLSVVGSLLHIANCVRCDIAYAVGCLARYAMTPGHAHVKAAKRVVKYLYATKNLGITFHREGMDTKGISQQEMLVYENGLHPNDLEKSTGNALKIFADSDYAMDYTKKSTMGIVFMLNGGPVSWTSVLGKTVATSTCEAEVNAAVSATKDAMHFKLMLLELGMTLEDTPIKIMEDNSACIAQAEGGIHHVRNAKHYEVKLRFLQESIVNKAIEFVYCPTDNQLADFFTKPLDEEKFLGFRSKLMNEVLI